MAVSVAGIGLDIDSVLEVRIQAGGGREQIPGCLPLNKCALQAASQLVARVGVLIFGLPLQPTNGQSQSAKLGLPVHLASTRMPRTMRIDAPFLRIHSEPPVWKPRDDLPPACSGWNIHIPAAGLERMAELPDMIHIPAAEQQHMVQDNSLATSQQYEVS